MAVARFSRDDDVARWSWRGYQFTGNPHGDSR